MSGRSAYVRKEKTKTKDIVSHDGSSARTKNSGSEPTLSDFPIPGGNGYGAPMRRQAASVVSGGSGDKRLDDSAYARVRKPPTPIIDVSGIEKSSFRAMMDKKSEGFRKGLSGFGKKKKPEDSSRPGTSSTVRPTVSHELEAPTDFDPQPFRSKNGNGAIRPGPPSGQLPPIPPAPLLRRFVGSGRPSQPWNKLRKDPELWDPHGDTLIFLAHETHEAARPPASFRVSSHVLERTESRFFATILREGCTEFSSSPDDSASTMGSGMRSGMSSRMGNNRMGFPNPPSISEDGSQDGQISYELYFPAPINQSKVDSLRFHVTTRNVFALLYRASLVGLSLFQALEDLLERLQQYMPSQTDNASLIIDYITSKGIDDARNDPSSAVSLLLWSELSHVRWQEGWREFFVHCAGMHNRLESVPELRLLSPITKALLERASLEGEVRIQNVEDRLTDFHFNDMWPAMTPNPPPERASFDRLRVFLKEYYQASCGSWPVLPPPDSDQWLTRDLTKRLQKDFGALYDYLVNRDVVWDCSEERSSRKWNIINSNTEIIMTADSPDLPMTDILVAFDNRLRYPHIPHPYPLVPDSIPAKDVESQGKISKKNTKLATSSEDKMAERRVALAYAEATNIYLLGPDFGHNALVSAFTRFEKADNPTSVDPLAARRGRWVLLYGILQALASISVDTPGIRYAEGVAYHLNPQLRGTPPWRKNGGVEADASARHEGSHCWTIPRSWITPAEGDVPMLDSLSASTSPMMSPLRRLALMQSNGNGGTHSMRSSAAPSTVGTESDAGSIADSRGSRRRRDTGDKAWNYRRGLRSAGGESDRLTLGSAVGGGGFGQMGGVPGFSPSSGFSTVVREHNERERLRERASERDLGSVAGVGGNYGPGIQKVQDSSPWPIREESIGELGRRDGLIIKDFDDYNF